MVSSKNGEGIVRILGQFFGFLSSILIAFRFVGKPAMICFLTSAGKNP